ncbi:MAG TPA: RHS repeat-associated core domain-containing protein [Chlorobiota bacterium]|nr:RHS repeat-associated core domain-containing protein [Chlorobiota bacterium]
MYLYDASGNRVVKRYYEPSTTLEVTTWYVRDAQGNTMAIYTKPSDSTTARLTEAPIYGSSRIGVAQLGSLYSTSASDTIQNFGTVFPRITGARSYELTDHLGNVRATISDIAVKHGSDWDAELLTRTDYYPFGMIMDGRNEASGEHRYGYNGKENDNEVKGDGNQQDYGFRIYDPRVARFLSVDPLAPDYPSWSPYPFAMNRPIDGVDLDGLEFYAANLADRQFVLNSIQEVLGSSNLFVFNGPILQSNPNAQIPSMSAAQRGIYDGLLNVVQSSRPLGFNANADGGPLGVEFRSPMAPNGGTQLNTLNLFTTPGAEYFVTPSQNPWYAIIYMNISEASTETYAAVGGGTTGGKASAVFIHAMLDHALHWVNGSNSGDPPSLPAGSSPEEQNLNLVRYHNDALQILGMPKRTGADHDGAVSAP